MNINFIESAIVRQNVLNNTFAINTLQQTLSLNGVMFERKHFGNEMDFVTKTLLTDSDRVC